MFMSDGQLLPCDPTVKTAVRDFKAEVMEEATRILSERMPQKILSFNKLVSENKSPWLKFISHDLSFVNATYSSPTLSTASTAAKTTAADQPSAVGGLDGSLEDTPTPPHPKRLKTASKEGQESQNVETAHHFPPHPQICIMVDEIKAEIAELIEMTGAVKLFIQLNVPRIEGGNNFGVQIQEEAINELLRVEDAAFGVCNSIVEYFNSRARFVNKIKKHLDILDYREALKELDEKKWMLLKTTRIDMRNNYAMLYDLLSKNWERVVKPRHADGSMIY